MLCKPSFRNYQMHIVCSYSVVQFLFQSLDTGEKNLPIYDLVLQLMAGREGWGRGGRVRGLELLDLPLS